MFKTGNEQEKEKRRGFSHDPTGETDHQFIPLQTYAGQPRPFAQQEVYGSNIREGGELMGPVGPTTTKLLTDG